MVAKVPDNADRRPAEELGPELRRAVEGILSDPPPEDLMRRTLDGLRQRRPRAARANLRRLAVAAALATAASIGALVLVGQSRNGGDRQREVAPVREFAADAADQLPTLWAYHRASLESPEALERLLDEHAGRILVSDPQPVPIGGLSLVGQEAL